MGWFNRAPASALDAQELEVATKLSIPAGRYSVSVRLIEAKNLQAIQAFNLLQTLLSFKLKTQTVHADRLPNVVGKVQLQRAGFEPQKRKTVVEKETAAPLWNQLFYLDGVEVAENELEACNVVVNICDCATSSPPPFQARAEPPSARARARGLPQPQARARVALAELVPLAR